MGDGIMKPPNSNNNERQNIKGEDEPSDIEVSGNPDYNAKEGDPHHAPSNTGTNQDGRRSGSILHSRLSRHSRPRKSSKISFVSASSMFAHRANSSNIDSSGRSSADIEMADDSNRPRLRPSLPIEEICQNARNEEMRESDAVSSSKTVMNRRNSLGSENSYTSASGNFILSRFASSKHSKKELVDPSNTDATLRSARITRRYGVGDYVLLSNQVFSDILKLVNLHGFAEWDAGEALISEERRGPYIYLLCLVKSVHFDEDRQYYTVTRMDNGEDQRADLEWMEPITNQRSIDAALRAVNKGNNNSHDVAATVKSLRSMAFQAVTTRCTQPFFKRMKFITVKAKKHVDSFLNGNKPYSCSLRLTGVNLLVLCNLWFLFGDQLRLAFAPHSMDHSFAIVAFTVWLILVIELVFEFFLRPSDYFSLVESERAYLPSTARYITNFHLISEAIALGLFIPEFLCLFDSIPCGHSRPVSLTNCSIMALFGPDRRHAFYGQAFIYLIRLRLFGSVRHWEKMWINNTCVRVKGNDGIWSVQRAKGFFIPRGRLRAGQENAKAIEKSLLIQSNSELDRLYPENEIQSTKPNMIDSHTHDYHLVNASKIGTALLTTNARRGLMVMLLIGLISLVPVAVMKNGGANQETRTSVDLLQSNNIATNTTDIENCAFFFQTVKDWIALNLMTERKNGEKIYHLVSLEIQPQRCQFQLDPTDPRYEGSIDNLASTLCSDEALCAQVLSDTTCQNHCSEWVHHDFQERLEYYAYFFGVRPSMVLVVKSSETGSYSLDNGTLVEAEFSVEAVFNEQFAVTTSILNVLLLQLGFTIFILLSLSVLRHDAGRLVLGPLRRMLKIVAFYATNPLAPPPRKHSTLRSSDVDSNKLGTFETEQLINTVTKITDLLRKCWGVAGAGIISSNLARQEGGLTAYFNPTVPGKAVFAIFAFVSIDNFKTYLHALRGDIMILINDVAAILHEEVYRWGYEDRGQCNKNLGPTFLMVYKIGAVSEVVERREKAEQVIFSGSNTPSIRKRYTHQTLQTISNQSSSSHRSEVTSGIGRFSRRHVDSLDLSSLPGMTTFTDRALLGLLKTFAGIHRDKKILEWNNDFRLGAGFRAVSIELYFGLDAGWAVEGAVGSSYKIDATYLSPHVNMASRMMSATKQYGVFFLLSEAVEGLLSSNAKNTLRHVDTVTVKGSSIQQKIFTFDAKVRNDFFLYSRSESQSDLDSERYTQMIWDSDQDLMAMRSHISDEFLDAFNRGRDEYLAGRWKQAIDLLKLADKLMFEREEEEGYSHNSLNEHFMRSLTDVMAPDRDFNNSQECNMRLAMGDGPCQRLIAFMSSYGEVAPSDWAGYRPLTNK